jgi:hypothetical protein
MNKTQAMNKLRKLKIQQFVRNNFVKFIPALKYARTETEAIENIQGFIPYIMEDKDYKYLFSLSIKEIASFTPESELIKEIEKCEEVLKKGVKK